MKQRYRYPGVRPFEVADSSLFFGRDRDCSDLSGLIAIEKLVVLFGKSGYGKSSLINAAMIPLLESRNSIAFSIRFGTYAGGEKSLSTILLNRIKSDPRIPINPDMKFLDAISAEETLWDYAKRRQEKNSQWVFFFDQFEEYFQQPIVLRRNFEEQLAELLYTDVPQSILNNSFDCSDDEMALLVQPLDIRVVFSIRADRMSELDGMKNRLPAILQKRFELSALNREQARDAIRKPAALIDPDFISPPFEYKHDALEKILKGLAGPKGGIEAFQLQILCDYIDNKVSSGMIRDRDDHGRPQVDIEDLPELELVYGEYYARRLNTLPPELYNAACHIIEEKLIFENEQTGEVRRVSMDKDVLLQNASSHGATEFLLNELENSFLLRRESNSLGVFTYEISHDTLLTPVIKAKRERLFKEREANAEQERLVAIERARKAEEEVKREAARRRRANILASTALILFLAASVLGLLAVKTLNKLKTTEAERVRAEYQNKKNDIDKVMYDVEIILLKADSLRDDYHNIYDSLHNDAKKLLEDKLKQYPRDTTLQSKLDKFKK